MDQSLDDLLAQLNLHQVTKFEPIFPQVETEDSDEDDLDIIHEKRYWKIDISGKSSYLTKFFDSFFFLTYVLQDEKMVNFFVVTENKSVSRQTEG